MLDYYLYKQVYELFTHGRAEEAKNILTELQEKYIEIADENSLLKTQIQEYEDILYLAKNLEYDGFSYWLKTGSIRQGPFCSNCYDKGGLLIRLTENGQQWRCATCGAHYEHKAPPQAPRLEVQTPRAEGKVIHLFK